MQVKCTGCGKALNIPDEKLPKDKVVTLNCPSCKAKIRVDQHLRPSGESAGGLSTPSPVPQPAEQKTEAIDTLSIISEEEEDELKIYNENDQLALVLDDMHKTQWSKDLEAMGYKIEYAKSPELAVHKMKFTQYHVVVLHENFGGASLADSPIYQSLREMPMSSRRKIFMVLVGKNFKSANNMQAFQQSANLVVNEKDMGKVPLILKKTISENEAFYKVFKETLLTLGKV